VQQIKNVFAPRVVKVLDYTVGGVDAHLRAARDGADEATDAGTGWSWWDRVHHVLNYVGPGARFDRMVALRPDVVLQRAPREGAAPPEGGVVLRLDEMCQKKPGLSFVTASWRRRRGAWLHDRDFDFMQILCPSEGLPVYELALRAPTETCKKGAVPALPPGFHSLKGWGAHAMFCRFVQVFQVSNISVSNWDDDYHLSWLDRFCTSPHGTGLCEGSEHHPDVF